jgi:hypothetical protein
VCCQVLTHRGVHLWVSRLPRAQPIHIAVVHREGSGDQHRIVNFKIGCTALPSVLHAFRSDLLAALLYLAGNDQQRL